MRTPVRLSSLIATSLFLVGGLAGCLNGGEPDPAAPATRSDVRLVQESVAAGVQRLGALTEDPLRLEVNITIHIVTVGIDPGRVDQEAIRSGLPTEYSPDVAFSPIADDPWRSGLMHYLDYEFHEAPQAFGQELFDFYPTIARQVEAFKGPGGTPGFLEQYDALYELGRVDDGQVWLVDALQAERKIEQLREPHGLVFEEPSYTIFFLDSWTQYDLWKDSYYLYEFTNDTIGGAGTNDLRTFGGTWDFFFMDYSAAPNRDTNDNSGIAKQDGFGGISVPVPAPEGTAYNDPPMWHYDGDSAVTGRGPLERTVVLSDRILHAVDVAVNLRMIGDYTFRPTYKETYFVNVHLWHDGRSLFPTEALPELLDADRLLRGLAAEIPWANVTGSYKYYVAPDDDPGMDLALTRAKAEGVGTYIPTPPVTGYIDANAERYKQNDPDVFDVMALLFILEGHYTFVLPLLVGGVAFGSPDGTGWGTITNYNDRMYASDGMDPNRASGFFIGVNGHEVGHFFGLTHAHDGSRRTANGYEPFLDHTWSATNTVMSYRILPETSDSFHREVLARAHTLENLELTLRNTASAYRSLEAAGHSRVPVEVAGPLTGAQESYNSARDLFEEGAFIDAVYAAIAARRLSEQATTAAGTVEREVVVESWSAEGVHSIGQKHSALVIQAAAVPTGVQMDYRPVEITNDVEQVTVRASWTNSPSSWGDFFVGWQAEDAIGVNMGPIPLGEVISLGGGIHDDAEEGPADGEVVRQFTLDIDQFPAFREQEVTLLMGAGTQGRAVNGAYTVEILVTYRDHGDGSVPDAPAATGDDFAAGGKDMDGGVA